MGKKFSNRTLFLLLGGLVVIFVVTNMLRKTSQKSTFKSELVALDSAAVESISIFPATEKGVEIKIVKQDGGWKVSSNGISGDLQEGVIQRILSDLLSIKPKRLAGRSEDQWEKYQLSDSAATRVRVSELGKGQTLDLYVGKFTYQQPQGGGNPYGGQQQIIGTTYVRLAGEKEAYAIDGFLAMTFNQNFNAFRNANFLRSDKESIGKITFSYPADSGFVLAKTAEGWMINEAIADSMAVQNYLGLLNNRPNRDFADSFKPTTNPDYSIVIEGDNMSAINLGCYLAPGGSYFLSSTLNPGVYFSSDSAGIAAQLFLPAQAFRQ